MGKQGLRAAQICLAIAFAIAMLPLALPRPQAGESYLAARADRAQRTWNSLPDSELPLESDLGEVLLAELDPPLVKSPTVDYEAATPETVAPTPVNSEIRTAERTPAVEIASAATPPDGEENAAADVEIAITDPTVIEVTTDESVGLPEDWLIADGDSSKSSLSNRSRREFAPGASRPLARIASRSDVFIPLDLGSPRIDRELKDFFPNDPYLDQKQMVRSDPVIRFRPVAEEPPEEPVPLPPAGRVEEELQQLRKEIRELAESRKPTAVAQGIGIDQALEMLNEINAAKERRNQQLEEMLRGPRGNSPTQPPAQSQTASDPSLQNPTQNLTQNSPESRSAVSPPIAPRPAPPQRRRVPVIVTRPGEGDTDHFDLQVDEAELSQVLEMLGELAGWNVIVAPEVSGLVSINLHDVTGIEALEALCRPRNLIARQEGEFIYVYPAAFEDRARTVVTKIYRPNYISTTDLQALLTPLLTPEVGRMAVTNPSQAGLPLDNQNTGGDSLSQEDALVIIDYEEVLEEVDGVVAEMDVPPPQVVIEAVILRVRLNDTMRLGVNLALLGGNEQQLVTTGSGGTIDSTPGYPGTSNSLLPAAGDFLAAAAGMRYGFLRGDISGFIEALEGITETSLVASPQIRVLNKQKAELIIGQRLGFRTRTFNGQQTIENVEFLDVGTKLILRPFMAPDGLVRLEIHPERSSGSIDDDGIPQVETTEVTSTVMCRDGATVVIGGLIDESVEENVQQVPLLGSIPWIGRAFRNSTESMVRNELIVLITPRVVQEPVESVRGDILKYESERRARHFADRLAPVSRRNLARIHVDRARELLARGKAVEARNHVIHALKIRKNDDTALRLLDEIEQRLGHRVKHILGNSPLTDAPVLIEPGTTETIVPVPVDEQGILPPPAPAAGDFPRVNDGPRLEMNQPASPSDPTPSNPPASDANGVPAPVSSMPMIGRSDNSPPIVKPASQVTSKGPDAIGSTAPIPEIRPVKFQPLPIRPGRPTKIRTANAESVRAVSEIFAAHSADLNVVEKSRSEPEGVEGSNPFSKATGSDRAPRVRSLHAVRERWSNADSHNSGK
ncbi:type II secretion system protein GspD [Stratiformator vulcanicus]|uniref:Type II secretion system protein D n=1 Tax=Stratiformator vulcanicus TaxID=2527980 RepID=A0A517R563_9PLAN|nr:hypothetical protein [Stratiformator vulcanicus]QDT38979.1 Putative type II secretion system protein D precursor [Stratiformator vulcanicus]